MPCRRLHTLWFSSFLALGLAGCGDDSPLQPTETTSSSGGLEDASTSSTSGPEPETSDSTATDAPSTGSESSDGTETDDGTTGDQAEIAVVHVADEQGVVAPYRVRVSESGVERPVRLSPDDGASWWATRLSDRRVVLRSEDQAGVRRYWGSPLEDPLPADPVPLLDGFEDDVDRYVAPVHDRAAVLFWDEPLGLVTLSDFTDGDPGDPSVVAVDVDMQPPGDYFHSWRWMHPRGDYVVLPLLPRVPGAHLVRASLLEPDPGAVEIIGGPPLDGLMEPRGFTPDGNGFFMTIDDRPYYVDVSEDVSEAPVPMAPMDAQYWDVRPAPFQAGVTARREDGFWWLGVGDDGVPHPPVRPIDFTSYQVEAMAWSSDGRWGGFRWEEPGGLAGTRLAVVEFSADAVPGPQHDLANSEPFSPYVVDHQLIFDEPSVAHVYVWTVNLDDQVGEIVRHSLGDDGVGPAQTVLSRAVGGGLQEVLDVANGFVLARATVDGTDVYWLIDASGEEPSAPVTLNAPLPQGRQVALGRFSPQGDYVGYLELDSDQLGHFALVSRADPGQLLIRVDHGNVEPAWYFAP